MISSLANFLMLILYQGDYSARVSWTLLMYTMGSVATARIAIEQNRAYSIGYAIALGLAAFVVMAGFINNIVFVAGLLVLIGYLSDRIVHDCTLIDESLDASGQGLIDAGHEFVQQQMQAGNQVEDDADSTDDAPKRVNKRSAHQPGRTVMYLALAALPMFGIGQFLLRGDAATWASSLKYLALYLFSSLSLLVTTSFLGLRRYLRQRKVDMPADVSVAWLAGGLVIIAAILGIAYLSPLPGRVLASIEMPAFLTTPPGKTASKHGWGDEAAEKTTEGAASTPNEDNQDGKDIESTRPQEGAPPGDSGDGKGDKGPTGKQKGGKKSGGDDGGKKSGGDKKSDGQKSGGKQESKQSSQQKQSKSPQNDQQQSSSKQDSQQSQSKDPGQKSQQDSSQQKSDSGQQKDSQQSKNGDQGKPKTQSSDAQQQQRGEGDPDKPNEQNKQTDGEQTDQKDSQQSKADQSDKQSQEQQDEQEQNNQSKSNQNQSEQSDDSRQSKQQESASQSSQSQSSDSSAGQSISKMFSAIGGLLRYVIMLALFIVVVAFVWFNREAILQWWRSLFDRDQPETSSEIAESVAAEAELPPRPFSSFRNPIGKEKDPRRIVVITFQAFEAWTREQGWKRTKDETPSEFMRRVAASVPHAAVAATQIVDAYNRIVYGRGLATKRDLNAAQQVWQTMS